METYRIVTDNKLYHCVEGIHGSAVRYKNPVGSLTASLSHDGILNMKWGRRRYQNPDGTLTELGKARLRAKREAEKLKDPVKYASMDGSQKVRFDQNLENAFDPNNRDIANKYAKEWATQDTEKMKKVTEAGSEAIRKMEQMERETRPTPPPAKRMDLRDMTDQELRDRINRENLERQYNQYFNQQPPARISKGRQAVQTALAVGGTVMATASTALGIALAIKQLKES